MALIADERRTIDIRTFADWLGISGTLAYEQARTQGHIAGVPVIRVGRRLLLPRDLAERALRPSMVVPVADTEDQTGARS